MVYHHCFSTLLQNMPLRRSKKIWWDRNGGRWDEHGMLHKWGKEECI
jgi:hypothetical protein